MAYGVYKVTEMFERAICKYTGAPYCVSVDNASNAMFLALTYNNIKGKEITIPERTYPSVPCEIIHAGGRVRFRHVDGETLRGAYQLEGSQVIDSALHFTHNMYEAGMFMICSFTGPYKHLSIGKGGAILTDNPKARKWFKRARFSGRHERPYDNDNLNVLGWNFYLLPELAARGLRDMAKFYDKDGTPLVMEDKELKYPDLSKFKVYAQ